MKFFYKILCFILVLCFSFTTLFSFNIFAKKNTGIEKKYMQALSVLSQNSILIPINDELEDFNFNANITRAEIASIMAKALGLKTYISDRKGPSVFTDVPEKHWANSDINKSVDAGIVLGYDNGMFLPDKFITYEEAIAMILRTLNYEDEAQKRGGYPKGYLQIAKELTIWNEEENTSADLLTKDLVLMLFTAMRTQINGETDTYLWDKYGCGKYHAVLKSYDKENKSVIVTVDGESKTFLLGSLDIDIEPMLNCSIILWSLKGAMDPVSGSLYIADMKIQL